MVKPIFGAFSDESLDFPACRTFLSIAAAHNTSYIRRSGQAIQYIQGPVARMVRCSASVAAQIGRLASPQADALGGPFEKKVQDFFREVCVPSTTFYAPQYRVCMSCRISQLLNSDFGLQDIFKGACLHVGVQTSAVDHQELQAR